MEESQDRGRSYGRVDRESPNVAELPNVDCSQDFPTTNGVGPHAPVRSRGGEGVRLLHAASPGKDHFLKGAAGGCHGIGPVHLQRFLKGIA